MSVPLIDGQGFLAPDRAGPPPPAVVSAVAGAFERWGFCNIAEHGAAHERLRARVDAAARAFFALPPGVKARVRRSPDSSMGWADDELTKRARDLKEVFDVHAGGADAAAVNGTARWPAAADAPPGFEAVLREWMAEMERVSALLLAVVDAALGLPPGGAAGALFGGGGAHSSFLRLNYYAPVGGAGGGGAEPPGLGISPHQDAGALTVLAQDGVAGLEVLDAASGGWVPVPPVPGALTINVGAMAEVLSNGRWRAAEHRVRAPPAGGPPRASAAYFFNPAARAAAAPHAALLAGGAAPRYRPVPWAEFRRRRYAGDVADEGEDEVQVDHYRL